MRIAVINGSMPQYDHGLGKVISVTANTLVELGVELDEINLGFSQLPYFDGMRAKAMDDIVARLQAADGAIIACTAQQQAPSAILQTFMEFFECEQYKHVLAEKYCLLAVVSKAGGERSALEYLSRSLSSLGCFESGRIGIQEPHARSIQEGLEAEPGSVRDFIEKSAEDFYRAIRQNRRYITPTDSVITSLPVPMPTLSAPPPPPPVAVAPVFELPIVPEPQAASVAYTPSAPTYTPAPPPAPPTPPAAKLSFDAFTEQQEQDIKELTALFSQKYVPQETATPRPPAAVPLPPLQQQYQGQGQGQGQASAPPQPKFRSVKQLTQNLPHYYQPQMAGGLTATIQLNISGADGFDGYLRIVDSECDYFDGIAENPEITIISDVMTWNDVLKGKHTAQKAFMIGGLKVRGNFVLLTKFDTLFKM